MKDFEFMFMNKKVHIYWKMETKLNGSELKHLFPCLKLNNPGWVSLDSILCSLGHTCSLLGEIEEMSPFYSFPSTLSIPNVFSRVENNEKVCVETIFENGHQYFCMETFLSTVCPYIELPYEFLRGGKYVQSEIFDYYFQLKILWEEFSSNFYKSLLTTVRRWDGSSL